MWHKPRRQDSFLTAPKGTGWQWQFALPIITRFTDEVAAAARAQTGVSELDGMKEVGDIFWAK
jgi:hypothetical protein